MPTIDGGIDVKTWGKFVGMGTLLVVMAASGQSSTMQDLHADAGTQPQPAGKQGGADPARAKVRAAVAAALQGRPIPSFSPPLSTLSRQFADVGACDYSNDVRRLCRRGDRSSSRTIVVFGDSHARHWIPAVNRAARRHGYAAYFLVKPGCNAADMVRSHRPGARLCTRFRAWAAERVTSLEPEYLVISGEVPPVSLRANGTQVTDNRTLTRLYSRGLVRTIRPLATSVGKVAIIGDVPGLRVPPKECLGNSRNDLGDCTFSRTARSRMELRAARRAATRTHSLYVDSTKWFCYHNHCPSIVDHVVTYRDLAHVLPQYSRSLARSLARSLGLSAP